MGLLVCDLEGRLDLGAEREEEEDAPVKERDRKMFLVLN